MGSSRRHRCRNRARNQKQPELTRRDLLALGAFAAVAGAPRLAGAAAPAGQLTWGVHTTLAPTWFDPAETPGFITPYMILYALHDATVKPMPGQPMAPSLAESWSASEDGLSYDFTLRSGGKFHNGDPVTAEDVKFSFERYRGSSKDLLHDRVAAVEIPDPQHVRFTLKSPWPDFMTFYATATGASWIVPKKYVESVGEDGFKKAPIGAGPYKFVSSTPGIDVVFEAFDQYWRKTPSVKRLVFKMIPDEATRLAALKAGEVDIVYSIRGELGEELRRTPGLTLKPAVVQAPFFIYFPDQWDPKSPWHDERVRRAASLAIDRDGINQAITLGYSKTTGSTIPENFDFYWQPPMPVSDPAKAKQQLAEAGYPSGFDAGEFSCDASYSNVTEAVLDNFVSVGIRCRLRPLERAAFFDAYSHKKLKNLLLSGSGAFGNAATRLEAFVVKGGIYAYGSYPDIDELFPQQAAELDRKKRAAILDKMQQLLAERTIYAPIWQLGFINGVGPRVGESGFGLMPGFAYTAPYEDITIKTA
jgi:peptide/nickel transport system substrate-binding protein